MRQQHPIPPEEVQEVRIRLSKDDFQNVGRPDTPTTITSAQLYQGLKRLLLLHPCQGRLQTVMDARPKGDMQVRVPGDVELVRRGELLWVTIGRGDEPPMQMRLIVVSPTPLSMLLAPALLAL